MRKYQQILNATAILILLSAGIFLYVFREQRIPVSTSFELDIRAKTNKVRIISNQFLVLPSSANQTRFNEMLDKLNLKLVAPILTWVLVEIRDSTPKIIDYDGKEAEDAQLILSSLLQHELVLDAQHNYVMEPYYLPREQDWQLHENSQDNPGAINAKSAWSITHGSANTSIAVVDTFLRNGHFTFKEKFHNCLDRVNHFLPFNGNQVGNQNRTAHGELMLMMLGACPGESKSNLGIDLMAKIFAMEQPTPGHAQSLMAALSAASVDICHESTYPCPLGFTFKTLTNPADIILLPFGASHPDLLQFSSNIISRINHNKSIVVTAAGNNAEPANNFFPGGAPGVINVGAINQEGTRAAFSNWGSSVDILAPGEDIEIEYSNGPKSVSGTSIAASLVAGTLGLMKAKYPRLNQETAGYFLRKGAIKLDCDHYCSDGPFGKKLEDCREGCVDQPNVCNTITLNAYDAVRLAQNQLVEDALIELSDNYMLFLRTDDMAKKILIKNLSQKDIKIEALAFDNQIEVNPQAFELKPFHSSGDAMEVYVSFIKEPFVRRTLKVEFKASATSGEFHTAPLYIEYIPKG